MYEFQVQKMNQIRKSSIKWKSSQRYGVNGDGKMQVKRSIIISGRDVYMASIHVEYKYRMRYGYAHHIGRIVDGMYVQDEYGTGAIYDNEFPMSGISNAELEKEIVDAIGVITESFNDASVFYDTYPAKGNSWNAVF